MSERGMWLWFGANPFSEAIDLGLEAGDGIARKIFVVMDGTSLPTGYIDPLSTPLPPSYFRRVQQLELVSFDAHVFIGTDPSGISYACPWSEASGYCLKSEKATR
jgi:hypothetical protein